MSMSVEEQVEQVVELPDLGEVLPEPSLNTQAEHVALASEAWRESVAAGLPLTGEQLGERFGESEGWGWDRIAEVLSKEDPREFARSMWRASMDAGQPLTGRQLGEWCRRSERWGRDRVAEVRQAGGDAGAASMPPARRRRAAKARNGTPDTAPDGTTAVAAPKPERHAAQSNAALESVAAVPVMASMPTQPDGIQTTATAVPVTSDVPLPGGARLVAWAGFLFGTAISVAANVLYAWLPTLAGTAGPPGLAPQVGAAVWPIALVISVEVLSRVAWRPGWAWQLARYGGAGVVAIGAAVISYGHLRGVLTHWGYGTTGAAVGPLVVDGLMTISGFALLAMSHSGKTTGETDGTARTEGTAR